MDFRFRDHGRRSLDQQGQEIESLRREVHFRAVAKKLTAIRVEREGAEMHAHDKNPPNFPRFSPRTPQTSDKAGPHHRDTSDSDATARRAMAPSDPPGTLDVGEFYRCSARDLQARALDGTSNSPGDRRRIRAVSDLQRTYRDRRGISCVVYIGSIVKLSQGMRGALATSAGWQSRDAGVPCAAESEPVARRGNRGDRTRTAAHVIEVVKGAAVAERLDWAATLDQSERLGWRPARAKHEADLAVAVTAKVTDELKRGRRARSPSSRPQAQARAPSLPGPASSGRGPRIRAAVES